MRGGGSGDGTSVGCAPRPETDPADLSGHYVVHVYGGPDTFTVWVHCYPPGETNNSTDHHPDLADYDHGDSYEVEAVDPQAVVDYALAQQNLPAPVISTSPGGGNPGLVGVPTWLTVENPITGRQTASVTEGLVTVNVWADPVNDGQIVWNTGEGSVTCPADSPADGSCSYTYERSSLGQAGADGQGRPAYAITASVTYTGGYEVFLDGTSVGTEDLGEIVMTSEPIYLAVQEAQAINTGG